MITLMQVRNFKSWRESGTVKLAPLTCFFGANNSGKSSLLQTLLLLKQTTEDSAGETPIFFGDKNARVDLGGVS